MPPAQLHSSLTNLHFAQKRGMEKARKKKDRGLLSPHNYSGLGSASWAVKWSVVKKYRGLMCIDKAFQRSPRVPLDQVAKGSEGLNWDTITFQQTKVVVDAVVDVSLHPPTVHDMGQSEEPQWS
jgi:hypothetical protein